MRDEITGNTKHDDAFYAELVSRYCADSIVITDQSGNTEWVNDAFRHATGYSLCDAKGKPPCVLMQGPDTRTDTMAQIQMARQERRQFQTEILHYTKMGEPFWVELRINPVFDQTGKHTHFVEAERDITARKELELANSEANAQDQQRRIERKLVSQTSEWLYSSKSLDELLRVVEVSMQKIFPEAAGELYVYSNSRDTLDLVAAWGDNQGTHKHIAPDTCWGLRRGRAYAYGSTAIEFPCDHHHAEDSPSICMPITAQGETIGLLHLSFLSISISQMGPDVVEHYLSLRRELALVCAEQISLSVANVKLRQELHDQSTRDPLTSLWNRRWFLETATNQLKRAQERAHGLSIISLDVDHFKKFNDNHGHDAGDVVLREIGTLMSQHFVENAHPCRIGGEEFCVLCTEMGLDDALDLAETFRRTVSAHTVKYGRELLPQVTVSAGVASYPDDGVEVLTLMKTADMALYLAKERGRNQIVASTALKQDLPPPSSIEAAE